MPFKQFENPIISSPEKPEKNGEKEPTQEKKIEPAEETKTPEKQDITLEVRVEKKDTLSSEDEGKMKIGWEFLLDRYNKKPTERETEVLSLIREEGSKASFKEGRHAGQQKGLKIAKERYNLSDEEYKLFVFKIATERFWSGGSSVDYGLKASREALPNKSDYSELLKYEFATHLQSARFAGGQSEPESIMKIWGSLNSLMTEAEKSSFLKDEKVLTSAEQGFVNRLVGGVSITGYINMLRSEFQFDIPFEAIFKKEINSKNWKNVVVMQSSIKECQPVYNEFLLQQKATAENVELPFSKRKTAIESIAGLGENGDTSIVRELLAIIQARTKQKEVPKSKWGLDSAQEVAFYSLMRLDNPDSNNALFDLSHNENVNLTVKYAILRKISSEKRGFLDKDSREVLHEWLYSRPVKELDWRDLEFVGEIQKIPSKELRDKSLQSFSVLKNLDLSSFPLYKTWNEKYSNIPQNVFLQALEMDRACGSKGLLEKFQKLFTNIRRESNKKDSLLYGITTVLEIDSQILKLLGTKLENIDFGSKQDADSLSELLRKIAFLNRIENIKNYQPDEDRYERDENREEQPQVKQPPPEITEIFSREAKNLDDLVVLIKEIATRKFQEILPNENITAEKIEAIEKEWGDLEPIFTYLSRYPQLKEYVAEIVSRMDTTDGWKSWRYDLKHEGVKSQIGHLSEEQLEAWKGDYFSEIGDIMVAETGSDKPKQIQHILQDATLQHRHIFSPEMGQNKNEFVSKALETVFAEIAKNPDKQPEIIDREIKNISSDARNIEAVINFNNFPRVRQSIESISSAGAEITPSSKIKNTISFLSAYLPAELKKALEDNYSRLEDRKKIATDELLTPEIMKAIKQRAREIEKNYQDALNSNIWEKFQLDKNSQKNSEQFYSKRQELRSATDLLRLLDLSNKLIATNRIAEKEGKKGGETITNVLERLKKYFKDSPLAQDINNIEFILREKIDFGEKRRLAMVFTDSPQMLWQAGKYPLGNGSCQHYAEGSYANMLMGYVGDPNCKVAYLVDLNRLPQSIRSEVEEKGFEEMKNIIPKQELLNASLARSIIKMTKDQKEDPAILIEPTYTIVYKGDASMDRYFNLFIDLMVAEPMKAKMARSGGGESLIKGQSLSPGGQYEDSDLNGVKFIHKLSKPTKEETEVMERIRSSR